MKALLFICVFVVSFLLSSGPAYIVVTLRPLVMGDNPGAFKNTPIVFILYLISGFSLVNLKPGNTRTQNGFYVLWILMVFFILEFLLL